METIYRVAFILVLVIINGFFVASEFALVAVRKTRINELVRKGNRSAKLAQKSLEDVNHILSATQLGITIASLAIGWIGEPTITQLIQPWFATLPRNLLFISSTGLALALAFLIITVIQIVLGELVPKNIALQKSEAVSLWIITPLTWFAIFFKPVIILLNLVSNAVVKIIGITPLPNYQKVHSEDEIMMLLRQSEQSGVIPHNELEMVSNVFNLAEMKVEQVMLPRTETIAFHAGSTIKEIISKIENHPHSRFPVYEQSIDNIIGFFHIKDIYKEMIKAGGEKKISQTKIIRDVISVPEIKKIDQVLVQMQKQRVHMAVVVDEYGGTAGIVTLEDILESVVGEIEDEFDRPYAQMKKQKDGSYIVDGRMLIADIQEKFKLPLKGQGYITVGGLVFGLLGHEPKVGDMIQISNTNLEVHEMKGKQIKKLKIKSSTIELPHRKGYTPHK